MSTNRGRGTLKESLAHKVASKKKGGNVPSTPILKHGTLEKQKKSVFGKGLQKRYCELYMGAFVYYHGVTAATADKKTRAILELTAECVTVQDQAKGRSFTITPLQNGRSFHFITDTEGDCKEWVDSIRGASAGEAAIVDVQCQKGHDLVVSVSTSAGRKCASCQTALPTGTTTFACHTCDYDLCKPCEEKLLPRTDMRCPKDHTLVCGRASTPRWCGQCRAGIGSGSSTAHCRPCEYDLCKTCYTPKGPWEYEIGKNLMMEEKYYTDSGPTVGIFVKSFLRCEDQQCVVVIVNLYPRSPIRDLMRVIRGTESLGYPVEEQNLMYGGVVLEPQFTLEHYHIAADEVIVVIHKIPIIQNTGSVQEILNHLTSGQLALPDRSVGCVAWSDRRKEHYHIYWAHGQWASRAQPTLTSLQKRNIQGGSALLMSANGTTAPAPTPTQPTRPVVVGGAAKPSVSESKHGVSASEGIQLPKVYIPPSLSPNLRPGESPNLPVLFPPLSPSCAGAAPSRSSLSCSMSAPSSSSSSSSSSAAPAPPPPSTPSGDSYLQKPPPHTLQVPQPGNLRAPQIARAGDQRRYSNPACRLPPGPPPQTVCLKEDIHWKRGKELDSGAYGKVFEALDLRTGGLMAVKQVRTKLDDEKKILAHLLEREIATMSVLSHPNIVQMIGTEIQEDKINILMEYVPGMSLAKQLKQFGPFSEEHARKYSRQLVDALAYCHAAGVVHRDLKGANILVTLSGAPKLADFGSAKKLADVDTNVILSEDFTYTTEWTAPEVFSQGEFNSKVDIWSLGCVVVEMLTGRTPWAEKKFASREVAMVFIGSTTCGSSQELPATPPGLSEAGRDFLRKCFQRKPEDRATAKELLDHAWIQV